MNQKQQKQYNDELLYHKKDIFRKILSNQVKICDDFFMEPISGIFIEHAIYSHIIRSIYKFSSVRKMLVDQIRIAVI